MEAKQCSFRFMLGQMRLEIPFFSKKIRLDRRKLDRIARESLR